MSTAIPYAGSKISLISKSDIRYVGTLHSINQQDSTVSLEQVRSYGTEGRKKNKSEEISGTDQVYEYIVFRGSDIKDLQVCEAPQQRPPVQVPKDPAILGTTAPPATAQIPPGFPMTGFEYMLPQNAAQMQLNPYFIQMLEQQRQAWQQKLQQQQPAAALLKTDELAVPTTDQNATAANIIAGMEKLAINNDAKTDEKTTNGTTNNANNAVNSQADKAKEDTSSNVNSNDKGKKKGNNNRAQNSNTNNYNKNYNYNNRYQRGGRQNYRRMNQRGGRRNNWNNSNKHLSLPDSDFDFESANAKFKELSTKETEKPETPKKETISEGVAEPEIKKEGDEEDEKSENFYDKTNSFFDNISCESKERAEEQGKRFDRRAKQYEERKLNMETFGQASVNRGGHRGYRRNNYHSYRGGRNYNNRNNTYHRNNGYRNNYYNNNNNNNKQKSQDQQVVQNQNNTQPKQEATQ